MKKKMLMMVTLAAAFIGATVLGAEEAGGGLNWRAKVGSCAQNPTELRTTIATLSAEDQVAFIAAVNEAIASLPGSPEAKGAMFLDANYAAVAGASATNRLSVLAEVFATVPPEHLTLINESFASSLFNRSGSSTRTFTDAEYSDIAVNSVTAISKRCASAENGSVRAGFAALMFLRASDGGPAGLDGTLAKLLPGGVAEVAKNEWFPAALEKKDYDPMLGAASAGDEPDTQQAMLLVTGVQAREAMLGDLAAMTSSGVDSSNSKIAGGAFSAHGLTGVSPHSPSDIGINVIPRAAILDKTIKVSNGDGTVSEEDNPYYTKKRGNDAGGYSEGGEERRRYPGQ